MKTEIKKERRKEEKEDIDALVEREGGSERRPKHSTERERQNLHHRRRMECDELRQKREWNSNQLSVRRFLATLK